MTRAGKIWCGICVSLPVGVIVFGLFTYTPQEIKDRYYTAPPQTPALTPQEQADQVAETIEQNSHIVLIKGECFLLSYPEYQYQRSLTWMPCPGHYEPELEEVE